jgi:hypothetical protein
MKTVKPVVLFVFGILAALLVLGCSQPTASSPGEAAANTGTYTNPDGSFTVTFTLRQDGTSRSVAGLGVDRISVTGDEIRNFVQLVAVDEYSKEIAGFAEARKKNSGDNLFSLSLEKLVRGKSYAFLILMGYWERTGTAADGTYLYNENKSPTLLCAGLTPGQGLNDSGDTKVKITVFPLVVDTKFERTDGLIIEPKIVSGKPEPAYITPGEWKTTWTVQRANSGTNGFANALVSAQKIINSSWVDELKIINRKFFSSGNMTWDPAVVSTGNSFDYSIGTMGNIGRGAVTFNLAYVPFNLPAAKWTGITSGFFNMSNGPEWIIRNGVNENSQDAYTDFDNFGKNTNVNGNGAVRFEVGLPPLPPVPPVPPFPPTTLTVDDGAFVGNPHITSPKIEFTTGGYPSGEKAEVWYAVVPTGDPAPRNTDYIWVDSVVPGIQKETISVPSNLASGDYDVYVIIYKDGEVSAPEIIRSNEANGNVDIEIINGVSHGDLSGHITRPVVGSFLGTASFEDSQYTASTVTWNPATSTFNSGVAYTATVTLTAKTGYTFKGLDNTDFICHNAGIGVVIPVDGNTATIYITFPVLP